MNTQELALTESRTLRQEYADRTDVLDKVKALATAGGSGYAFTSHAADYFDVTEETISMLVKRNRAELAENGYKVMTRAELERVTDDRLEIPPNFRRGATFQRRTVLNLAMLMDGNVVAQKIRTYLLDVEEIAGPEIRNEAMERAELSRAQVRMLKAADGLLDTGWLSAKAKVVIARGLGEEPEINTEDVPLYVPDFVRAKGVTRKADIESIQSWFGRRVAGLYEEAHGTKPGKRTSELPNGQIRETYAWTQRDLPLFEEVWEIHYAARYTPQTALDLGDGA